MEVLINLELVWIRMSKTSHSCGPILRDVPLSPVRLNLRWNFKRETTRFELVNKSTLISMMTQNMPASAVRVYVMHEQKDAQVSVTSKTK